MLSNAEKSLNRKKSSALGQSPEDALTARSKMIKRRPYLQKALMDKQQLPIGTIVRIHMMVQKRFAAEVKVWRGGLNQRKMDSNVGRNKRLIDVDKKKTKTKKKKTVKHQYQVASPGGRSLSPGVIFMGTRSDTQLPQSRAGGQGLYLRSLDHLGRSTKAKTSKT